MNLSTKIQSALSTNSNIAIGIEPGLDLYLSSENGNYRLTLVWNVLKPIIEIFSRSHFKSENRLAGSEIEVSADLQSRTIKWHAFVPGKDKCLIEQTVYSLVAIKEETENLSVKVGLSKNDCEKQGHEIHNAIKALSIYGEDKSGKIKASWYSEFKRCFFWTAVDTKHLTSISSKIIEGTAGRKSLIKFIEYVQAEAELVKLIKTEVEQKAFQRDWNRPRFVNEDEICNAWKIVEGSWRFIDEAGEFSLSKDCFIKTFCDLRDRSVNSEEASSLNSKLFLTIIFNSGADQDVINSLMTLMSNKFFKFEETSNLGKLAINLKISYEKILRNADNDFLDDHRKRMADCINSLAQDDRGIISKCLEELSYGNQSAHEITLNDAIDIFPILNGRIFVPLPLNNFSIDNEKLILSNHLPNGKIDNNSLSTKELDDDSVEAQLERAVSAMIEEEDARLGAVEHTDHDNSECANEPQQSPFPTENNKIQHQETPKDALGIFNQLQKTVIGQEAACKAMAAALHANRTGWGKGAVLICGKTGTGKSHLVSQAAKILNNVKVVHVSAPALVPEGIRGQTLSDVLLSLLDEGKKENHVFGEGIIVFDEIDKLVIGGGIDQYYRAAINNILRLIDGCVWNFGTHEEKPRAKTMDTSKLLIILAGAWQEASTEISTAVGFEVNNKQKDNSNLQSFDLGFPQELQGRISRTIRLNDHTVESLLGILESETVSPWLRAEGILGKEILVSKDANDKIARKAVEFGLGARYLDATVTAVIDKMLFEQLDGEIIIDEIIINEFL